MKFAFVALFITLLTQFCLKACVADQASMETVYKECQAEHGVNESQFADLGKPPSDVDRNLKCFNYCFLNNMGLLDEEGKLDGDKFLESNLMPSAQSDKINDCKAMHDMTEDQCEYIFDLFYCITA